MTDEQETHAQLVVLAVAADTVVEGATTFGFEPALVLAGLATKGGIAMRVLVSPSQTGDPPDGAIDVLKAELDAAITRFLGKCPNAVMFAPKPRNPQ
jgi:hypothetical protein